MDLENILTLMEKLAEVSFGISIYLPSQFIKTAGSIQEIYYLNTSERSHWVPIIGVLISQGPLTMISSLALAIPEISVGVRRLHDIGKSGWWWLIIFTGIGGILLIIWWASKS